METKGYLCGQAHYESIRDFDMALTYNINMGTGPRSRAYLPWRAQKYYVTCMLTQVGISPLQPDGSLA
jgi:hypothetical protein